MNDVSAFAEFVSKIFVETRYYYRDMLRKMISKDGTNDMIEQENYSDNTCVMEQAITVINDTKSDMI